MLSRPVLRWIAVVGSSAAIVVSSLMAAAPVQAYGSTHLWQVTVSQDCNNATICNQYFGGTGGQWIWAELDSGGTGDLTVTFCSHQVGNGPAGGAQHINVNVTGWTVEAGSAGPATFFLTGEIDTITGRTGGPPIVKVVSGENFDTGVPAVAGHYRTSQILGFSAPGVTFNITVVAMH